jgi:spoIIIJ-associated protein
MLEKMGVGGEVEIKSRAGNTVFNVLTARKDLFLENSAQGLDALQIVVLRILNEYPGGAGRYVCVDVENYKGAAEEELMALAKETAAWVIDSGQEKALGNLTAAQRRIVHWVLKDSGVETVSLGQGPKKKLLVKPKQ